MIGIVGAGVSGLALAAFLAERGAEFRIWEAAGRAGGVIRSSEVEGRVLDHGPQRTRVTPSVRTLIRWAGVEDEIVEVAPSLPLYVYRSGALRTVPLGMREFLRTDLLSARAKARVLLEPLFPGPRRDESVADFLTRKLGVETYRNLAGPLFGGLYGSDPADMPVQYALTTLLHEAGVGRSLIWPVVRRSLWGDPSSRIPAVSFRTGLQAWTDAMAERLGPRLSLESPVTGITQTNSEWRVSVRGELDVAVRTLVLTVPSIEAARLLETEAPDAAERLAGLRYNRIVMVHLLGAGPLDGLGYQVALGERLRTRGVTWNAAALGRDGLYTAFLGGARDPGLPELSDREIGSIAVQDFERVTGARTRVLAVGRTRIPAWDRSWQALDGLVLPPALELCTNYESRVGIPGRVRRARELSARLA